MILRSAFWLCVGFALVAPHGTDFGAAASQVREQAIAAGSDAVAQLVVSEVLGGPVANAAARELPGFPSVASTMQDSPTPVFVFPRPRPAAMG